jgi:hypothetical protein
MNPRPWTSPRRLTSWSLGAVIALILCAPALGPSPAVFAHEVGRPTATTTPAPPTKPAVQLEGTLEIIHEDREDGTSRYHHTLTTADGARVALDGVAPGLDLLSGDHVRVQGHHAAATTFQLQPASTDGLAGLEVLAAAPLANTFGAQKTLVILVNFSNAPTQPYSVDQAKTAYATLDAWFREASYQQTSLAVDVAGWFTLSLTTAGCNTSLIQSQARQAAAAAGVNLSTYVRHVFAFPFNANCLFAGMGTVGGTPSSVWINGNTYTGILAHEFGHTLGLYHSHALNCHPSVLTPPCLPIVEYGDTTDAMGGGTGHYNAFQKQRLGWLDFNLSPPITPVSTSGSYTIAAYELPGTAPKALKIPRGTTGQFFFVELRRPLGWDAGLYRTGAFIHLASDSQPDSSIILDMTPTTSPLSDDAFLDVGKRFTDPVSGVTITTVSVSGTDATIQVDMTAPAACTPAAPSITASPIQSPLVQAGTAVTYTVVVTNTDSAGCPASTFALQATAPTTSWLKTWGTSGLFLAPGATASTTLRITSPVVPAGSYPIVLAATNTTDSTYTASTTVYYNVASDGPVFTDSFDRPDSDQLDNGWSVMTGSLMVQASQGRNQPDTTFSLGMQLGRSGPAHLAEVTVASTNNNSAPRFGVVVRYQNDQSQSYYLCYRQVGGSSILRIAKVQNGVETVLKSVGIANPAVETFFKLSCQASGTTLTLSIDGVIKLSTTNGIFTTGSTGYTISTKKGSSHRTATFTTTAQ